MLGLGPGSKEYILPVTTKIINTCDVLIGGKRNLQYFEELGKEILYIDGRLNVLVEYVKKYREKKKIAFLLSGDTGFYSMLNFLKKHFKTDELEVVPGISSYQYLAAKIGEVWQDAFVGSLHGRSFDFLEVIKKYHKVFLLTDYEHSPTEIARSMIQSKISGKTMIVGENLSYDEERIIVGTPEEIVKITDFNMSVVVIKDAVDL